MVDIISRGVAPEDIKYRGTCMRCTSVLEFKAHESTALGSPDQRDADGRVIACPVCRGRVVGWPVRPGRVYER